MTVWIRNKPNLSYLNNIFHKSTPDNWSGVDKICLIRKVYRL